MAARDLGLVTAYAYAVSKGYTGTEEEYAELMASYGTVAEEAAASAAEAAASEGAAAGSATAASGSAMAAASSASAAAASETAASGSASAAASSATEAAGSATAASGSATAAASSASAAGISETNAGSSATAASGSATAAAGSAASAEASSLESEGYAKGTQSGTEVPSSSPYYHANSKYYKEQAEAVAASIPADYTTLSNDVSALKDSIADKAPVITENLSGDMANIYDGADNMLIKSLVAQIVPVQDGEGDPSFSNVRPIHGFAGCKIVRSGKNILGGTALRDAIKGSIPSANVYDDYVVFQSNASSVMPIFNKFKANTAYTFVLALYKGGTTTGSNLKVFYTDGTSAVIPPITENDTVNIVVFTSNPAKSIERFGKVNLSASTRVYFAQSGIFEGELTAEDFVEFDGDIVDVTFPESFGDVYGGSIDVITGDLDVHYVGVNITRENTSISSISETTFTITSPVITGAIYQTRYGAYSHGRFDNTLGDADSRAYITSSKKANVGFKYTAGEIDPSTATIDDLWDWIEAHVPQPDKITVVAYRGSTPLIGHSDPHEIITHLGENHIYSDIGDVTVEYPCDTKLYIQQLTNSDNDMVADNNITNGSYFMVGNNLYLASANIAAGEMIVPGTNCTATNLAEALNAINA